MRQPRHAFTYGAPRDPFRASASGDAGHLSRRVGGDHRGWWAGAGLLGFTFFLLKGLLWLAIPLFLYGTR